MPFPHTVYYYNFTLFLQDWSLRIQRVDPSDSGTYKCQANSHPPQFIATYLSIHGIIIIVFCDHTSITVTQILTNQTKFLITLRIQQFAKNCDFCWTFQPLKLYQMIILTILEVKDSLHLAKNQILSFLFTRLFIFGSLYHNATVW